MEEMERIQNLKVEDTVTEMVEVATDKLTFKDNVIAYSLAGIFMTGLVTVGYLGYKGTKKLASKIRDKRVVKENTETIHSEDGVEANIEDSDVEDKYSE